MSPLNSSDKIEARHFHSIRPLIDDLAAINDDRGFGRYMGHIYSKELELKVKISVIMLRF